MTLLLLKQFFVFEKEHLIYHKLEVSWVKSSISFLQTQGSRIIFKVTKAIYKKHPYFSSKSISLLKPTQKFASY